MRAVIQRVLEADIEIVNHDDQHAELTHINHIDTGMVVLLGVEQDDNDHDLAYIADKLAHMRIFADDDGNMNHSIQDINGEILLVSQFTLFGDLRNGRRPSFGQAAAPEQANALYQDLIDRLLDMGLHVKTGHFQTHMQVYLNNDGPVTILLDSRKQF